MQPEPEQLLPALATADLTDGAKQWFSRAQSDEGCVYFTIQQEGRLIGQTLLHDIDREQREALVGYHIFRTAQRGRGYGTAALAALCHYAFEEGALQHLVMITSIDNTASRRIAEKCGFREIGPAREGPHLVAYELPST